jgi:NAD(P)-dependent dehydrogenase (short-subunit alcohol dehydrogenase family)
MHELGGENAARQRLKSKAFRGTKEGQVDVKTDEGKSFVLGMQALKRIGQPDDVGSVVAFLASQDARWITGDTIRVDGGSKL